MFFVLLLIFRFDAVWNQILILSAFISALFSGEISKINITFNLIDQLLNLFLFLGIVILFFFRGRFKIFEKKISPLGIGLFTLSAFLIFAPTISNWDPGFQKDLSVTKLLPPFSEVKILHLKESEQRGKAESRFGKLLNEKFGETVIFIDSLQINSTVQYFQNSKVQKIRRDKLRLSESGEPIVTSKLFLLGTDEFGRDIFSRIIYGTRVSVLIASGAVLLSLMIASILGFISAFYGKWVNIILNRTAETIIALPILFLIVLTLALFGNNIFSILFVLGAASWMSLFKVIHNEILAIKKKDFFVTARLIGLSNSKLLLNEIFPVIRIPIIINCVLLFGNVILAEAALSYLGLGLGNTVPSWGGMIDSGQNYIHHAWWMITFPGITLVFALLTVNALGNKLNKIFNQNII